MEWCKKPLRKKSKRNLCVSLFIDKNNAIYFDSFGIEYFPQEVLKKIKKKLARTTYLEYKMVILLILDFLVLLS